MGELARNLRARAFSQRNYPLFPFKLEALRPVGSIKPPNHVVFELWDNPEDSNTNNLVDRCNFTTEIDGPIYEHKMCKFDPAILSVLADLVQC
jgi:hypothetical protein